LKIIILLTDNTLEGIVLIKIKLEEELKMPADNNQGLNAAELAKLRLNLC